MLPSHEMCPICGGNFLIAKRINKDCPKVCNKKISYLESICNIGYAKCVDKNILPHIFFQITSLYGEKLFEKISFLEINDVNLEISYPLNKTTIYYIMDDHDRRDIKNIEYSRIIELDYPDLQKIISKIKNVALFL